MGYPRYFKYLPNLDYTVAVDKAGNKTDIEIKDYFNLLKVRDDLIEENSLYDLYTIKNGQRPEQISEELYEDTRYYWVILQVNDIIDYYNEWPLSSYELDKYIGKKYGSYEKAGQIRHYETVETRNNSGSVVLQGGIKVTEDFEYSYRPVPGQNVTLKSTPVSISHREYEYKLNADKSQIRVVNPEFIVRYEEEVRDEYNKLRAKLLT